MFAEDEETSALLRQATALLECKEGDEAIRHLYQARDRMMVSKVHYPVETWCKLPLYLSRIGRFDEAMAAFDWLLEDLPRRARKESFMDDPDVSFGRKTPKTKIYNMIVSTSQTIIEEKRAVALRRQTKALGKLTNEAQRVR